MKAGRNKVKVRLEHWVKPGEHQTLQDILDLFAGRVIKVDAVAGEVLVSCSEESYKLDIQEEPSS
jgi:hypothetical protein